MIKKVIVIGGGAAGIFAALALKEKNKKPIEVMILERQERIGKKLLVTGNGKCNLTNAFVAPHHYNHPEFIQQVLPNFDFKKAKEYFYQMGLLIKQDEYGRCYPYSESAKAFLDLLMKKLEFYKIQIHTGVNVKKLKKEKESFLAITETNATYVADYVIVATGSPSFVTFPYNSYTMLHEVGHTTTEVFPALCALKVKEDLKSLNNIRVKCTAKLIQEEKVLGEKKGEILFKDTGLSGILSLELSSIYQRQTDKKSIHVKLDLAPEYSSEEMIDFLKRKNDQVNQIEEVLSGVFHKMIANQVLKRCREVSIEEIVYVIKNFTFHIEGTLDFKHSQVTVGGIDLSQMNTDFSSKIHYHLYIIGEVLDIDGDSGGFNLHFAWLSGYNAAQSILARV